MLGSYHLAFGEINAGVGYFRDALSFAESENIHLGVSHSELGAAYLHQGRLFRGLDHLKRGADLLSSYGHGTSGEYSRALRKLMIGYAVNGRLLAAYETRETLRRLVEDFGYQDQYQ